MCYGINEGFFEKIFQYNNYVSSPLSCMKKTHIFIICAYGFSCVCVGK